MSRFDKKWDEDLNLLIEHLHKAIGALPVDTELTVKDVERAAHGVFGGFANANGIDGWSSE